MGYCPLYILIYPIMEDTIYSTWCMILPEIDKDIFVYPCIDGRCRGKITVTKFPCSHIGEGLTKNTGAWQQKGSVKILQVSWKKIVNFIKHKVFALQEYKVQCGIIWHQLFWEGIRYTDIYHYNDVIMSPMACPKSLAFRLFAKPFVQTQSREYIKTPRHWFCEGNPTGTCGYHSQRASNAENVSIWWRLHVPYIISLPMS